jgi:AdoMet-dependent heme synthase
MRALEAARDVGLETQVQITVTAANRHRLDEVAACVEQVRARAWSLTLADDEVERTFEDIYEISLRAPFEVKTEGERYRRFLKRMGEVPEPVRDSRGFVFISHTGEIHPSGFLPVSASNVRYDPVVEVYRNSSLFSILCGNDGASGGHTGKYAEVRGLALML